MAQPAPRETGGDYRVTVERYFSLVDEGVLDADDRVELLDGVIVAMAPQNPGHAGTIRRVARALRQAVGGRAEVSEDKPLVLAPLSAPEPDVAVVPIDPHDYLKAHPTTALLVVEVSDSSLPQDRLTKARIYAGAGIPEYWIVDLVHGRIEVFRAPQPEARRYASKTVVEAGARLELVALPGAVVPTDDLLPLP
jgi:Uma2 family endonuclease